MAQDPAAETAKHQTAITIGDRSVDVAEVLRACRFRGDLAEFERDLLLKIACQQHAAEHELEPEKEQLQALADKFRYERDLITMEETEQWLEARGLGSHDFATHIVRAYWKDQLGDKLPEPEPPDDPAGLEPELITEMLLTGDLWRMARRLAWRLANYRPSGSPELDPAQLEAERARFLTRTGLTADDLPAWLEAADLTTAQFDELLTLEAAYDRRIASIVTPEGLARTLRSQRLALTILEVEEIEFDTLEAAREAILCVREDHLSMEEVAQESRYPYFRREFVLEELPTDWQVPIFSTPEGGLAGPYSDDDLIRLFRVQKKIEPELGTPAVRDRIEQHLVRTYLEELCTQQGCKLLL